MVVLSVMFIIVKMSIMFMFYLGGKISQTCKTSHPILSQSLKIS